MPLLRIDSYPGVKHVFIAGGYIADLATVELLPGERQVGMGSTGNEELATGVARGTAVSGDMVRVVTQGILSGVKTADRVDAGDRLTIATSGCVVPLNYSVVIASGLLSGVANGIQGPLSGAGLTGRILGKALTSGASGKGIQMLVSLG